jgi:hypothetical protein
MTMQLAERDVKQTCESFLYSLMNLDRLIYLRLQAGDLIIGEGDAKRRVRCCPKGTSDGLVIVPNPTRVVFVEYKSTRPGAKQTREQAVFDKQVTAQGHQYWLVSDSDAFNDAIGEIINAKK